MQVHAAVGGEFGAGAAPAGLLLTWMRPPPLAAAGAGAAAADAAVRIHPGQDLHVDKVRFIS